MQRLASLTLTFAVLSAVFIIAPAFLSEPFTPYPLIKEGNILDLFTPLVLIPFYWLLFDAYPDRPPSRKETLLFLLFAVL